MHPIFLIGAERSGTTLLRLMLNSHPQISWLSEFEYAVDQIDQETSWPNRDEYINWLATHRIFRATGFSVDQALNYQELVESFLSQKQNQDEKQIIGATCHRHYDQLLRLFPKAKFIYLLRDPRDVARSNIGMGWAGNVWAGVDRWVEAEHLWTRVKKDITPQDYIEVKFEDVITSPEAILTKICTFMNVQYNSQMMSYPDHTTYSRPNPNLTEQWKRKLSKKDIELVEYKTKALMIHRGYHLSSKTPQAPSAVQQLTLAIQNKFKKIIFRIERFGWSLFMSDYLARKLSLSTWARNTQLKINAVEQRHLK